MAERPNLTTSDFREPVGQPLVDALNDERAKIRDRERRVLFLREHRFHIQAEAEAQAVNAAMDVWVGVCNALGKFF